jgi:hypothetical protein
LATDEAVKAIFTEMPGLPAAILDATETACDADRGIVADDTASLGISFLVPRNATRLSGFPM